jgi:hypothetical protein
MKGADAQYLQRIDRKEEARAEALTTFEWLVPARAALYALIGERLELGRKQPDPNCGARAR